LTGHHAAIAGILLTGVAILLTVWTRNVLAVGIAMMFLVRAILNLWRTDIPAS
jgi:hypothetical protein